MKKLNFRKILKITGYTFLGLFVVLLLASFLIPYFFKDDIKAKIDEQIAQSINAQVNLDLDKLSLSVFRNFPNITASLDDFSIVGKDEFAGDTLVAINRSRITIDIWSVIFGPEVKVRGIYLKNPHVYAKVLSNGKANWDIGISTPEDSTATEEPTEETKFDVGIRFWEIENGKVTYEDATLDALVKIEDLNHKGTGNFNQEVFDLDIQTDMGDFSYKQYGMAYLANKKIASNITLNMNLPESKYTFKDNQVKINDFSFGFEGFVQLLEEKINLDIKFSTQEDKFKNILSLVPGMFTEQFNDLKTSGLLKMEGFLKGETDYEGNKLPAFNLSLLVKDGMFQYPTLPKAVNNVQVDLNIDNKDGVINNTNLALKKFHIDFGTNPIDAKATVEGLENSLIDALVSAKLNLGELSQFFPLEGNVLKGDYSLNLKAKGRVTETQIPAIDAKMLLRNGYLKSTQYPDALENLLIDAQVTNTSGKIEDTQVRLNPFKMVLDKEPFEIKAIFSDLNDIQFDMIAKGGIDLGKVMKLYPIEGMDMSGKIRADIQTKGRASYAMNGQYDKIPTSGTTSLSNFEFKSTDLPQGMKITQAQASFTPQSMTLEKMDGFIGKSDMHANGVLSNYMAYLLAPNAVLKGVLDFRSNRFLVDEWMTDTGDVTTTATNTVPVATTKNPSTTSTSSSDGTYQGESLVVEIPKNIDFRLNSDIKEVIYDKLKINDLKGIIIIQEGKLRMENVTFKTLGGGFNTNFVYDPTDLLKPKYEFGFGIDDLPIGNLLGYTTGTNSTLAKTITGDLNTLLQLKGNLSQGLIPLLDNSLNGKININILRGLAKDLPMLDKISSLTNLKSLKALALDDVLVKGLIEDGKVNYQPFDIKTSDLNMNISGSNTLEGALDLLVKLTIPKNKVSLLAITALKALGGDTDEQGNLKLNFKVGGNYLKPDVKMLSADAKATVIDKKKEEVEEKVDEVKSEVKETINEGAEAVMEAARKQADLIKSQARQQAQKIREEADAAEKKTIEEAAKKGLLAKKTAEIAAKKVKESAYKKADQLVVEADRRADQIIKEGQEKADKLK
jgi:hypothetical protein